MSKTKRVVMLCGIVLLAFFAMTILGHRSSSAKRLQEYKAKLQAEGEKLSYAEFIADRKDVTNDSLAIITNAIDRLAGSRLRPGLLEVMKFEAPGQARAAWKEPQPYWLPQTTSLSWQELGEILTSAKPSLEEIRLALRDPAPDMGVRSNLLTASRPFIAIRSTAQWLAAAGITELHQGDLEQALKNLEAEAALSRLHRDDGTLVSQMIRVAVAGLGLSVTWEALQAPGWTEPQLQRLQKAWAEVDLIAGVETGFRGERAGGEEVFATVREGQRQKIQALFPMPGAKSPSGRLDQYALLAAYKITSINDDELLYLKTMQGTIDAIRRLRAVPLIDVQAGMDANFAALNKISGPIQQYHYWFSLLAIPNYQRAFQTAVQKETQRQLTVTAIAFKRFELRNGHPAPNLQALVPEFLPALPRDYFSTNHLQYRIKEDGSPVLYSVGTDGHDDQGDPTPSQQGQAPDLWSGRDAVWPQLSVRTNR
jgi:hypothetical protein